MVQVTVKVFRDAFVCLLTLHVVICRTEKNESVHFVNKDSFDGKKINFSEILEKNKRYSTFPDICPLRIVGGVSAPITSIPYQVVLRRNYFKTYWFHFCGGALVTLKYVVTAAHCFVDRNGRVSELNNVRVVAGTVTRSASEYYMKNECWRRIYHFWQHEYYDDVSLRNDFGVIEVEHRFNVSDSIKPIRIHTNEENINLSENDVCLISGYGLTEKGTYPVNLRMVCVPIVTLKICKSFYDGTLIHDRVFCAGVHGKDSCTGDSGGPIVCQGVLAGVVSFGGVCGGSPGVYTRLSTYTIGGHIPLLTEGSSSSCDLNLSHFCYFIYFYDIFVFL